MISHKKRSYYNNFNNYNDNDDEYDINIRNLLNVYAEEGFKKN